MYVCTIGLVFDLFQSSATLQGGCNLLPVALVVVLNQVSILSHPPGRLQQVEPLYSVPTHLFQSSATLQGDCNVWGLEETALSFVQFQSSATLQGDCNARRTCSFGRPSKRFNPQPPSRATATVALRRGVDDGEVSILSHPPGRLQRSVV